MVTAVVDADLRGARRPPGGPPFTRTQIQAAGDWAERSGRRLACIYATHGHGDHWFGTGELARRFPGVTVYATEGTIEVMRQQAGPSRVVGSVRLPGLRGTGWR